MNKEKSSLHPICSYTAMFPYEVPRDIIADGIKNGTIDKESLIVDPFSGRGTTILEASKAGIDSIGIDLSPLAFVLSKSRAQIHSKEELIKRINELEKKYKNWINKHDYRTKDLQKMRIFYSKNNLRQILFIREKLGLNYSKLSNIDNFILASILGIMHGPILKDGKSNYLSISMPNTMSMSPNYVAKYKKEYNLSEVKNNLFDILLKKIERLYKNPLVSYSKNIKTKVFHDSALHLAKILRDKKADIIITSPPYLNIINYQEQNWIRMWLLGGKIEYATLDDKHTYDKYKIFISKFLDTAYASLKNNGQMVLIIGDVRLKKMNFIFEKMFNDLKRTDWKIIDIKIHRITRKLSHVYKKNEVGATDKDRIYFLKKIME